MLSLPAMAAVDPGNVFIFYAGISALWCVIWAFTSVMGIGATVGSTGHTEGVPWREILMSKPVWAITASNFSFHYVVYGFMGWLPTYFDSFVHAPLGKQGLSKALP